MKATAVLSLCLGGAAAFIQPAALPKSARSSNALRMSLADIELEAGKTAPFPEGFDPLGLAKGKSFKELKKWREAELKHGRVAMLAVLGFIVQENFHPLWGFGDKNMEGAVYHFQEIQNVYPLFWTTLVFLIGLTEARIIARVWDQDVSSTDIAGIREDAINGDLGWDPLRIIENQDSEAFIDYRNKELNNGRLAMIAIAGLAVQERFVTNGIPEFDFSRFNAPASTVASFFMGLFA